MIGSLSSERLRELVVYDPITGIFTRRVRSSPRTQIGDVAGGPDKDGYIVMRVDCKTYKAHRLAILYMTGEWPPLEVDHRDGIRSNNKWDNLRNADRRLNVTNVRKARRTNGSGLLGAHRDRGRFKAVISTNRKKHFLGMFDTAELAHAAYVVAKRQLHEGSTL